MKKGDYLEKLLRSPQTVFSMKDIALSWGESSGATTRTRLHYYLQHGKLIHLRHGLYAKDNNYNPYELAIKINTPAYISFETVLKKAGFIFQYYKDIFVASYLRRTISCGQHTFVYRRIKSSILTNPLGIEHKQGCAIASYERAVLDTLYLNKDYHFDNLSGLNWDKAFEIVPIYDNKRMKKKLGNIYRENKEDRK